MPPGQEIPLEKLKELLSGIDPDQLRKVMPPVGGVITMMFTDIVDSTRVKREVGDKVYFEALGRHNDAIRECCARCDGHELKTIGDAFFITFADPLKAVECGSEIQEAFASAPIRVGDESISVRIGIHTGTPIVYRDPASNRTDLSGSDVDKASRVETIARGGQVLISEQTHALASSAAVHDWGPWELKGLGSQRIFEVLYSGKRPEMPAGRMWLEPLRFATPFIGREQEVASLVEALKRERLVTATGMGGVGKTRLADAAARRMSDAFEDGTFFVELADVVNSESAVVSALASRLGVDAAGFQDEADAVVKTFQNRHALVVLDNFESVISAAPLIGRLFLSCPGLHILVTSQVALNIRGEQLYEALRMVAPDAEADATSLVALDAFQLFRARARNRTRDWDPHGPAEAAAVAEILRLTEGIPLAIELAAAWVGSRTLQEILTGLAKRPEFLKRRGPGSNPRHASMTACLDYSFELLPEGAKELFPKLSVFAGGFFAEDVEAVCGVSDAAESLITLDERSLLVRQELLGRSRYSMLAAVQKFAREKLPSSAAGALKQAHAEHFLEVLTSADLELAGKNYGGAMVRMTADFANFEAGMRASEGNRDYGKVIDYSSHLAAYLAVRGRFSDRLDLARAARAAAKELDVETVATADNNLGTAYVALPSGHRDENLKSAIECYEAALRVWTEQDFPQAWATTQNNLGTAYASVSTGDRGENLGRAIECFEAAARGYAAVGMRDDADHARGEAQRLKDRPR